MVAEHTRAMFMLSYALQESSEESEEADQLQEKAMQLRIQCDPIAMEYEYWGAYDRLVNILWR